MRIEGILERKSVDKGYEVSNWWWMGTDGSYQSIESYNSRAFGGSFTYLYIIVGDLVGGEISFQFSGIIVAWRNNISFLTSYSAWNYKIGGEIRYWSGSCSSSHILLTKLNKTKERSYQQIKDFYIICYLHPFN